MAYGLKYIAKAYGLSSVQWKVELYEKDYVPSVGETPIELNLVGDGIKLGNDREDDRFNVIYSRYATIDLKITESFDINTLQFDDEQKYQVKIYQGSTLDFIGWLIPFYSSQEFEDTIVTTISIQAKDGIKQRLKNKNFVNEHPEIVSNKQSVKDIICQCLRQVGYNSNVEIYYNKYESSMFKTSVDCPLAQLNFNVTALEKDSNTNITYYDVLIWLLEVHGLHIKQVFGTWRIINQVEVIDGTVTGRVYDYQGNYLNNNTLGTDLVISKIKRGALIRKDIPFQQFSAFYQANLNINILANGKFDQFVGLDPVNWTKVGSWSVGQVSTILDSNGIQFNNTYTTDEGLDTKYFESSAIDITGLSSFTFKAEAYADSDIDSVKIAIILYNSSNSSYTYYVDKYGSIKSTPVTALIDKGQTDRYVGFDLSFITNSATQYLNGVDRIKIRIYPGVRLRDGVPTNKKVKYRNLVLTGQANSYDADFLGRVYEYKNTDLPSSKVADEFTVNFQDNLNTNVAVFRNTFFIGDTNNVTSSWKRTGESESYTLIESLLIDRLSLTAKFNDIFEGEAIGYIDHTKTPLLLSESKRYLVLHYEYNLQQNTTELVLVELASSSVNFSKKIYDRYKDDKTIDVSDGKGSSNIAGNEAFDSSITSNGGTMYGGVFLDWGIDAIPATSTDPRATNKGVLKVGPEYAQTLELGNRANDTLVDVLGRLSLANNVFYDNGFPLDDGTVLPRLGLNSSELFVEGDFHTYGKYLVNNGLLTLTTETYSVEDNISAGVVSAENERLLLRGAKGIEAQNDFYLGKSYLSNEDIYSGGVFTSSRLRANTDEFQIAGNLNFDTNSKLKINGSFGGDHTFLKSVGDRMEWKDMTVGEIADIDPNFVRIIVDDGERGFSLYSDYDKNIREAFFFTNPDTGIVGMHGFRLNGSTVEQYGFQMLKDGKPYWLYADGTRKRLLTELDLTGISGGGTGVTYTLAEPLYFINNQINIRQASSSQTGVLTAANWNTFNSKLADGFNSVNENTFNANTNFNNNITIGSGGLLPQIYFKSTQSTETVPSFKGLIGIRETTTPKHVFGIDALNTDLYLSANQGDINLNSGSSGSPKTININARYIVFNGIEIDFTTFGIGKVLKGTYSSKAEWVTP